jgi:hypothetical protein
LLEEGYQVSRYWRFGIVLLIGIVGGGVLVLLYTRHHSETTPPQWLYVYYTGEVAKDLDALIRLRRAETELVITHLEEDLSDQLYDLAQHFRADALSSERDVRMLKTAAKYRSEHPFRTGDPEKDRVVDQLLAESNIKE